MIGLLFDIVKKTSSATPDATSCDTPAARHRRLTQTESKPPADDAFNRRGLDRCLECCLREVPAIAAGAQLVPSFYKTGDPLGGSNAAKPLIVRGVSRSRSGQTAVVRKSERFTALWRGLHCIADPTQTETIHPRSSGSASKGLPRVYRTQNRFAVGMAVKARTFKPLLLLFAGLNGHGRKADLAHSSARLACRHFRLVRLDRHAGQQLRGADRKRRLDVADIGRRGQVRGQELLIGVPVMGDDL